MEKIFAQTQLGGSIAGDGKGLGPFAGLSGPELALQAITKVVSSIIGVMTVAAGIWFLFNFIIGGVQWISSGGDKHGLEQAQQRITNAFIGLIIVVAGWAILALVSQFLGIDFLLSTGSMGTFISNLKLQ